MDVINLNFDLYVLNVLIGWMWVKRIVSHELNRYYWLPLGWWIWQPNGKYPPVGEFWLTPRQGGWYWQIDNPSRTHIMLAIDQHTVGGIAEFPRREFEKGNRRLTGPWLIKYEDDESGGEWRLT
jgi:hypothetical protein